MHRANDTRILLSSACLVSSFPFASQLRVLGVTRNPFVDISIETRKVKSEGETALVMNLFYSDYFITADIRRSNTPSRNHLGADGAANESDRDREEIKISKVAGEEAEHLRYTARPRLTIERVRIEPGRLPPSALINGSRVVT